MVLIFVFLCFSYFPSIIPSKCIHTAANGKISVFFYGQIAFHCMYVHNIHTYIYVYIGASQVVQW